MIRPFLFGLTLSYLAIDNILDGPFREFLATYFDLKAFGTNTREEYLYYLCLLYTSPSPRDRTRSRMPSSA